MKWLPIFAFIFSIKFLSVAADCWETGCQPNSWAVKGCAQYSRTESGRRPCKTDKNEDGYFYTCCSGGGSNPPPGSGSGGPTAESGICSWYGADGEIPPGWPTSSGEGFDRFAMTAAHKTLPFGTRIRVKNESNGKTVDVRINDRGPFTPGRIVDLTYGAFGIIENRDKGVTPCSYVVL